MRQWQVLTIGRTIGDKYVVTYLLDDKERRTVQVDATFGLEWAITEAGKQLALLPPMERPSLGVKKKRFPFVTKSRSDQTKEI